MDFTNKDFSDDSLMAQNDESIRENELPSTGPALTGADSDRSPYGTSFSALTGDGDKAPKEEVTRKNLVTFVDSILQQSISDDNLSQITNTTPSNNNNNIDSGNSNNNGNSTKDGDNANTISNANDNTNDNNKENNDHNEQDLLHSFQTAVGTSLLVDPDGESKPEGTMEFTKNYSDDLLMGKNNEGIQTTPMQGESHSAGNDLADFELPPYSGSSSVSSDTKQQSPVKAQSASSTSSQTSVAPPNLTALRELLLSNYSKISYIFHWRRPIESGICFGLGLTIIIALTFFSIISVIAYSTLGVLLVSGSIRLYKTIMKALNRSADTPVDHIWDRVQNLNVSIQPEKMHELIDSSLGTLNASLIYFKQVLLVEDKVATLKFGAFIYFLTYIGAWFNGLTLITISYLVLFSVPILYEKNKSNIDQIIQMATGQVCSATSMVTNKLSSLVSGGSPAVSTKKQE